MCILESHHILALSGQIQNSHRLQSPSCILISQMSYYLRRNPHSPNSELFVQPFKFRTLSCSPPPPHSHHLSYHMYPSPLHSPALFLLFTKKTRLPSRLHSFLRLQHSPCLTRCAAARGSRAVTLLWWCFLLRVVQAHSLQEIFRPFLIFFILILFILIFLPFRQTAVTERTVWSMFSTPHAYYALAPAESDI